MKISIILFTTLVTAGCEHLSVSNPSLLSPTQQKSPSEPLRSFPIGIDAQMSCSTSVAGPAMGGVSTKTQCSNRQRINMLAKIFRERGIKIEPSTDPSTAQISVYTKKFNGFLEGTTGFVNLMTLGIVPLYSHTDYIVSYKSPKDNIVITKTARIATTRSWFSLLLTNPENLTEDEIKSRVEEGLIRSALDEAKI